MLKINQTWLIKLKLKSKEPKCQQHNKQNFGGNAVIASLLTADYPDVNFCHHCQ